MIVALVISGLLCTVVTFKFMRRLVHWCNRHNSSLADIDQMSGLEFERYIAQLLKRQGYRNVRLTEKYDFGVDIIAEKDGIRFGIQVKRYSGPVSASSLRQVVTALKIYNCDKAIVITNSSFSEVAKRLAKSNDCILIDRSELKAMS